jgi:hypothetical protein
MTLFLENAQLLWWIVAIVFILRWFHLCSSRSDNNDHVTRASGSGETSAPAKQIPSGSASRLFTYTVTHSPLESSSSFRKNA